MSNLATATLPIQPLRIPRRTAPEPSIEVVANRSQRRARPKVAYAIVVVASLGGLMLSQLALSIALSDGAYTIDRLEVTQKEQARAVQLLGEDLGRLSSPQNLAVNAEALGMVQNANPVWLRMSDGAVIGSPTAAAGGAGVLGTAGSKVANQLLAGVPLVTQLPPAETAETAPTASVAPEASTGATPGAATGETTDAPLASDGRVPAPTTR
ncbi:hypothetical protein ACFSBZ_02005 [Amnibacterium flavum]|uniref:Cell division protein FtsL n=1 Tax=Amnibacterium flavum TaxID=2173173 RepID=A0A2V1HQ09_9MICO|nr:hypothetical protein [Amnibacterium flavum]PVZ94686.1 hypothetical protein DDQ50_13445 [Amnibacterium flavum]